MILSSIFLKHVVGRMYELVEEDNYTAPKTKFSNNKVDSVAEMRDTVRRNLNLKISAGTSLKKFGM